MRQAGLSAEFKNYQWGQLMLSIAKGAVVPVIGPELLSVEVDGRDVNLYRHVAERLALELDMETPLSADDDLGDVVTHYMARPGSMRADVYYVVWSILRDLKCAAPKPLRQLAEIEGFRLFISTTFDSLMHDALKAARSSFSARFTRSMTRIFARISTGSEARYRKSSAPASSPSRWACGSESPLVTSSTGNPSVRGSFLSLRQSAMPPPPALAAMMAQSTAWRAAHTAASAGSVVEKMRQPGISECRLSASAFRLSRFSSTSSSVGSSRSDFCAPAMVNPGEKRFRRRGGPDGL